MARNKIILKVKKDKFNSWYKFEKGKYRLQLCWDTRKDWFWIKQYADKVWLPNFMADFTKVLKAMAVDESPIFTLYEWDDVLKMRVEEDGGE